MPPRKQPPSLKDAARGAVIRMVTYQVRVLMSTSAQSHEHSLHCVSAVVSSLASLPAGLREAVVGAALRCADPFLSYRHHHPARRVLARLLAALLPPWTRSLSLPLAESYPLREALLRHLATLRDLRDFTLSETLHVHVNSGQAECVLRGMPYLTVLRAPWILSDAMALTLAEHCPLLQVLDASESARLSERGVDALAKGCPDLSVCLLTGCRLHQRDYEKLLARLPRLKKIGRCPRLSLVVALVVALDPAAAPLGLTEWDSDHLPVEEVAALCPALAAVSLSDVVLVPAACDQEPQQVEEVACLPEGVQRLRVERVGLRDHPSSVRLRLHSLTHLDVREPVSGLGAVEELGRQCRSLRVLRVAVQPSTQQPAVRVLPARDAPFRELHELHVYSGPGPALEYVLVHALALRRVTVEATAVGAVAVAEEVPWTDAAMRRVLAANQMAELQHWSLACPCALTMDSVYSLILTCPKLCVLLDLAEWLVSEEQADQLRELTRVNNWNLQLSPHA